MKLTVEYSLEKVNNHRLEILILSVCLLAAGNVETVGGDVCVAELVTVVAVKGTVVSIPNESKEPIPGATIELMKCRSGNCSTVAQTTADEKGHFKFEKISPGRYELRASATNFKHYTVRVVMRRPSRVDRDREDILLIALEAGFGCGGWAKLQGRTPD